MDHQQREKEPTCHKIHQIIIILLHRLSTSDMHCTWDGNIILTRSYIISGSTSSSHQRAIGGRVIPMLRRLHNFCHGNGWRVHHGDSLVSLVLGSMLGGLTLTRGRWPHLCMLRAVAMGHSSGWVIFANNCRGVMAAGILSLACCTWCNRDNPHLGECSRGIPTHLATDR